MRHRSLASLALTSLVGLSSLLIGCADGGSKDPGAGGNTGGDDAIALTDANNFITVKSELNIQSVDTAAASVLDINWSGIKNDILCHPVNPAEDIDDVVLLRLKSADPKDVAAQLDSDTLDSNDLVAGWQPYEFQPPAGTMTTKLNTFAFNGTALDVMSQYVQDANSTYMLVFQKGVALAHGAVSMLFLKPGGGSATSVSAPDNAPDATGKCPLLTFQADLMKLTHVAVPKSGPVALDWRRVKMDSRGAALAPIDRVLLGFYANKTVDDLQADFLNLEIHDSASWELTFNAGKTINLSGAKSRKDGTTKFTGFDSQTGPGTWIMGLFCDSCSSPAPQFVTILDPQ